MSSEEQESRHNDFPEAKLEHDRKTWLFWLIPVGAAALAGWFIYSNMVRGGPTLHIYFQNASGLQQGKSTVKYRGAQVGVVKGVELTKNHEQVEITIALDKSAESLARDGSRFWIVKPEVGLEEISGLRTIVSGDYIAVEPGGGKKRTKFEGLPEAPIVEREDVLKVVVLSERGGALRKRTPVFYRGFQVGEVFSSGLGPESQTIQSTVHIKKYYAPLVRANSKFWNAGGINMRVSLSGLNISAQSAEALLAGGIDFATPDTTEKGAQDGTVFRLYDQAQTEWLAWAPVIRLDTNAAEHAAYQTSR